MPDQATLIIPLTIRLAEAAKLLDLSPRTITRMEEQGKFPPRLKFGRTVAYDRTEFELWYETTRQTSNAKGTRA